MRELVRPADTGSIPTSAKTPSSTNAFRAKAGKRTDPVEEGTVSIATLVVMLVIYVVVFLKG